MDLHFTEEEAVDFINTTLECYWAAQSEYSDGYPESHKWEKKLLEKFKDAGMELEEDTCWNIPSSEDRFTGTLYEGKRFKPPRTADECKLNTFYSLKNDVLYKLRDVLKKIVYDYHNCLLTSEIKEMIVAKTKQFFDEIANTATLTNAAFNEDTFNVCYKISGFDDNWVEIQFKFK